MRSEAQEPPVDSLLVFSLSIKVLVSNFWILPGAAGEALCLSTCWRGVPGIPGIPKAHVSLLYFPPAEQRDLISSKFSV